MPAPNMLTPAKRPAEDDKNPRESKSTKTSVSAPSSFHARASQDGLSNRSSLYIHTAYKHDPANCNACIENLRIICASEELNKELKSRVTKLENHIKSSEANKAPTHDENLKIQAALKKEIAHLKATISALEAKVTQVADKASATLQARTKAMQESFNNRVAGQVHNQLQESIENKDFEGSAVHTIYEERAAQLRATHLSERAALEERVKQNAAMMEANAAIIEALEEEVKKKTLTVAANVAIIEAYTAKTVALEEQEKQNAAKIEANIAKIEENAATLEEKEANIRNLAEVITVITGNHAQLAAVEDLEDQLAAVSEDRNKMVDAARKEKEEKENLEEDVKQLKAQLAVASEDHDKVVDAARKEEESLKDEIKRLKAQYEEGQSPEGELEQLKAKHEELEKKHEGLKRALNERLECTEADLRFTRSCLSHD
ncbi:hypothetical protein F5B20DRAFT_590065 [Whalleya microplaca]|nr:hypothetical protein F5B20DRAFT_590065 [Whalleya microplaca]